MNGIQRAVYFLWGAAYASCIWWVLSSGPLAGSEKTYLALPIVVIIFSTIAIVAAVIYWLVVNWNKE